MDNDLCDGQWASNYDNSVFLTSDSPVNGTDAGPVRPASDQVDQPSGEQALPLLRLSGWDSEKQYDKYNPVCIHYDFQWKISQREKIRARRICSDTEPDLVLSWMGGNDLRTQELNGVEWGRAETQSKALN